MSWCIYFLSVVGTLCAERRTALGLNRVYNINLQSNVVLKSGASLPSQLIPLPVLLFGHFYSEIYSH
jgi:hypothetical protein